MSKILIDKYIKSINDIYNAGGSTEHSFRATVKDLLESMDSNIFVQNESERIRGVGMPDLTVQNKKNSQIKVGRVECKDIWIDLDYKKNQDQLDRYIGAFDNFIYTNHLEFVFYRGGRVVDKLSLGKFDEKAKKIIWNIEDIFGDNVSKLENLLSDFMSYGGQTISSSIKLAQVMASKAKLISYAIKAILNGDEKDSELFGQIASFREVLIHDLSVDGFADMYAQTIVYGLFAARINDTSSQNFSREEASKLLPKTNPFLRRLFNQISIDDATDNRISYIIDDLILIFRATDMAKVMTNHGKNTAMQDPILHFYETFLGEYDQSMRKAKGVYYTPQPVVDFIVRSVDKILIKEFGLRDGLADTTKIDHTYIDPQDVTHKKILTKSIHQVQVLDPATGTGTFLDTIIKHIYTQNFQSQAGSRSSYVKNDILPRIHGFELLMASYAMCHLKLGQTLKSLGYDNSSDQRLGVYLTNSLEEPNDDIHTLFSSVLAKESKEAGEIKKNQPIMIIIGNPPYSVSSTNKSEYITNLIKDYKKNLNEKKINLDDDYIKFIHYAQDYIDRNGSGIVAYISNNSFVDGITHRQMRLNLMQTFDDIYIVDLHGNSKKKEKTPDGGVDQNVFDIQQGVSINIFIKTAKKQAGALATIHHTDIYGRREVKYDILDRSDIYSMDSLTLLPHAPYYFFVPKDFSLQSEYDKFIKVDNLFGAYSVGIGTKIDGIAIDFDKSKLENRILDILQNKLSLDEIKNKYQLGDNSTWEYGRAITSKYIKSKICLYDYRPFDKRYIYYDSSFLSRNRGNVMDNFFEKTNLGLELSKTDINFVNFISNIISDEHFGGAKTYKFPLYIYGTDLAGNQTKTPNLNMERVRKLIPSTQFIPPTPLFKGDGEQSEYPLTKGVGEAGGILTGSEGNGQFIPPTPLFKGDGMSLDGSSSEYPLAKGVGEAGGISLDNEAGGTKNSQKIRVLRQHPVDHYILDFYIASAKLAIEIDGDSHFTSDGLKYDEERTDILSTYNIKVLRFTNDDIYHNLAGVTKIIYEEFAKRYNKIENPNFTKEDIQKRGLICNGAHLPYNPNNIDNAKSLRKEMTKAEQKIWFELLCNFISPTAIFIPPTPLFKGEPNPGDFPLINGDGEQSEYPLTKGVGEAGGISLENEAVRILTGSEAREIPSQNPEAILDYIYAILHSPSYRTKYAEFLKIDFPRIPPCTDQYIYNKLSTFGRELRLFHLMEHELSTKLITKFPIAGSDQVTKPIFQNNNIYINSTQYFEGISEEIWNMYIGGYQPAQKWLKDRKNKTLGYEDIRHYQMIIVALSNTITIMSDIDLILNI